MSNPEDTTDTIRITASDRQVPEWSLSVWPLKIDDRVRIGMLVRKHGVEDRILHLTPREARLLARDILATAGFTDAALVADEAR